MIVFIHGLNTYGDDDLHVGPLAFGPMHARLEEELKARGHHFLPVLGLGFGSPEEQAEKARPQLPKDGPLYLFGQSTGGLVARVLAAHPALSSRIHSVFTIGTPHRGTAAAEFGLNFETRHPQLTKIFSMAGYDTRKKAEIFSHYTPKALHEFNQRYSERPNMYSLICEVERRALSWPLRPFYKNLHPANQSSDGFIWAESQSWGESLGPFQLDHFTQLGFFPFFSTQAREHARREFDRLIAQIDRIVSK